MKTVSEILSDLKRLVTRPIPVDCHFGPGGNPAYELVLDASPSMEAEDYPPSRFAAAKQAAKSFVSRCAEHTPEALVGVVFYSYSAQVASSLVPVRKSLRVLHQAVDSGDIGAMTNISAGLTKAESEFAAKGHDLSPVIVLLTDGHSNQGRPPVKTASELKETGIQIDIIGIGGSPADVNEEELKRMASVVNGQLRYWFIRDPFALVRKFEALALGRV